MPVKLSYIAFQVNKLPKWAVGKHMYLVQNYVIVHRKERKEESFWVCSISTLRLSDEIDFVNHDKNLLFQKLTPFVELFRFAFRPLTGKQKRNLSVLCASAVNYSKITFFIVFDSTTMPDACLRAVTFKKSIAL
jgi:hypothetical protein